ncbi:hypothetical protein J6TS2_02970 [Heyndrickxia sporothermodurans]|nr:hypothetical protein J6TS2_02970 [Heyndrickxia sporothermodurans]
MDTVSKSKSSLNWMIGIYKVILSESILLAILLFPIRLNSGEQTISWFLLIILAVSILFALLLSWGEKQKVQKYYYFVSIPIIIFGSLLVGIPIWITIIMFLFSQWRIYQLIPEDFDDDYFDNQNSLLLLTIIFGIAMYGIGIPLKFVNLNSLLVLILMQFFMLTFGTFVKNYFQSYVNKKNTIILLAIFVVIIPITISTLLVFVSGGLRHGFLSMLTIITKLITLIVSPFVNIFSNFLKNNTDAEQYIKELEINTENKAESKEKSLIEEANVDGDNFYIILFIVFIILVTWLFLKFRRFKTYTAIEDEKNIFISQDLKKEKHGILSSVRQPRYSIATHQIRKCMYELERSANKKKYGRKASESVRDWIGRLQIKCPNRWIQIYEEVRYGKGSVTKSDVDYFLNENKLIKKQIKEKKSIKKDEEAFHNLPK